MKNNTVRFKTSQQKCRTFMTTPQSISKPPKKSTNRWIYGKGQTRPEFRISTWNVNGIRAIKSTLDKYIAQNKIHILCVNQTKINQEAYDQKPIQLDGYSAYWNFCKCSAGYSGVAIFSKFLPLSMEEDLPQPKHQHQGRLITLQFQKFYLISVYVVNSGTNGQRLIYRTQQWDVDFRQYCQDLKKKKHVIIAGDLNVVRSQKDIHMATGGDLNRRLMPGCTLAERKNMENFLKLGWIDTFREMNPEKIQYTWWNAKIKGRQNGIGWRIDYIIVNEQMKDFIKEVVIREQQLGSDHSPLQAVINFPNIQQNKQKDQPATTENIENSSSLNDQKIKNKQTEDQFNSSGQDKQDQQYNNSKKKMNNDDQLAKLSKLFDVYDDLQEQWGNFQQQSQRQEKTQIINNQQQQNHHTIFHPNNKQISETSLKINKNSNKIQQMVIENKEKNNESIQNEKQCSRQSKSKQKQNVNEEIICCKDNIISEFDKKL